MNFVRFEIFTAMTMKNAVLWDVVPCEPTFQGKKIRERGTSVSRWLQTESLVENTQLYKKRKGGRVGHMGNQ
jgi:hypothetical protein